MQIPLRCLSGIALLIGAAGTAFAQSAAKEPLPPVPEVVTKIVARFKFEKDQKHEERYAGTIHNIADEYNKKGEVEKHTDRVIQPFLIEGHIFYRLMLLNGQPLNDEDRKKQIEREQKFRENLKKPPKEKKAGENDLDLNEELFSRFNINVLGVEEVSGRPAYLMTFLPKAGVKLPENKRVDKILNRLQGKLWIDRETYSITRVDIHLTEPVSMYVGLGNIRVLDFYMEMSEIAPGIFATREQKIEMEAREMFKTVHFKQHGNTSDYHKVSELAEAKPL